MSTIVPFLQAHPTLSALLGAVVALAAVGLWYVISNHLKVILTTLFCTAGAACGAVVFWRGIGTDLTDLLVIGVFLMVVFPVMFAQAVHRERKPLSGSLSHLPGMTAKQAAAAQVAASLPSRH